MPELSPKREELRKKAIALIDAEIDKRTPLVEIGRMLVEQNLMSPDAMSVGAAIVEYWRSQRVKLAAGEIVRPCSNDCLIKRNTRGVLRCAHSGLDASELQCDELIRRSGAEVARETHNLEVAGSSPASAT